METIEAIFENYKAGHNEETPFTQEQQKCFDIFSDVIEKVFAGNDSKAYHEQQLVFEKVVAYARASEKAGFILGFKMAMNIMRECK